jgi:hypothetical protein
MPNQQWTYATLEQALQDWPENDNETYIENLPNMIGLAELRLVRDLDLELFDRDDESITFAISSRIVPKPANAVAVRSVGYIDNTLGYVPLKLRTIEYCKQYAPLVATEATPIYYAEYNEDEIYVVPTPDVDLTVVFRSNMRPTVVLDPDDPTATSWLSTRVPDALFAACLMEAEHYMQADDRYGDYKTKYYEELLPAARYELRNLARNGDYSPFAPAARSK